jgi:hypothetical protein
VRASYNRLRPLEKLQVEKRGWTLDVLQVVQSLGKLEFTLADVYVVVCPSIPGCYSQCKTVPEALANIREAIDVCLEDMQSTPSW